MTSPTILLVEDNPITRKLVRFTLENQGFRVVETTSARSALESFVEEPVSLVLQDLCLPDMDGYDLVGELRALPGGSEVPILVFSGMLSQHDEARVSAAGFDDLITKPVEPSRLIQIVRSHLPVEHPPETDVLGAGRRIVVADDDAVQRKLIAYRMQKLGFEVHTAADGEAALEQIRRNLPHVVLSDVLMPGLDGFGLCMALRRDPTFSRLPIVLTTNSYVEATDRDLARAAGAHDLVIRTPELREVTAALRASLRADALPAATPTMSLTEIEGAHTQRMMRQLERQVVLNAGVNQRCALLAAEMTVLKGIAEALAIHADIDEALRHTLAACFDAGGISLGALYLLEDGKPRVLTFGLSRDWAEPDLIEFFGERTLLDAVIESKRTALIGIPGHSAAEQRLLRRVGVASMLIAPIVHRDVAFGALVMLAKNGELQHEDRVKFGEAVAGQISQALAMAHAFRARERTEFAAQNQAAILSSVLESIGDGIAVVDGKGNFILWNSAAQHMVDLTRSCLSSEQGKPFDAIGSGIFETDMTTRVPSDRLPFTRAMRGEESDGVELFVRHAHAPDGMWLSTTGRPWRDARGAAQGGVVAFRDVTREKVTQSQLMVSDRMASVGMLAAGVAHEINNPLACVLANLELSQLDLAAREAAGVQSQDAHGGVSARGAP
jgi:CheY-like chemotaxis protein